MENYNENFYPTPKELINKMIRGVDFKNIKNILEPSAGSGNIIEELNTKNNRYDGTVFNVDAIEIDENLQNILKGKGLRLIHNDFLTFNSFKKYDLIVANFPFSDGDAHLLKAIQIQERLGGSIICLINAETIKNPYTNQRKALLDQLDKYNASIEYLQEEFTEAERKTNVEVALIKLNIEKTFADFDSIIFDNLQKAEVVEVEEEKENQLIDRDFLKAIVTRYNFEVKIGLSLINEWCKLTPYLLDRMSTDTYARPLIKLEIDGASEFRNDYHNCYIEGLRLKYWTALFKNPKFVGNLTSNLKTSLEKKVNELKDYDFSLFNIEQIQKDLNKNTILGIEKAILDYFDELTCKFAYNSYYKDDSEYKQNIHYYNGWASNKAHRINKKVILPINGFSSYGDKDKIEWGIETKIQDMEKIFNFLSSGGQNDSYVKNRIDNANVSKDFKNIDFKYFTVTFYKKGTCHLVFKDDELLEKFNIFGSQRKGWLPPCYGKKSYRDMNEEEKNIVKDFQGENKYNQVMNSPKDYIIENNQLLIQ